MKDTDVARDDDAVVAYCAAAMAEDCANFQLLHDHRIEFRALQN